MGTYSVDSIGPRILSHQEDKINKIYNLDIPDIVIINKDDEIWDYALNSTAIYLTYRNERNHIKKVRLKKKGGKDGR